MYFLLLVRQRVLPLISLFSLSAGYWSPIIVALLFCLLSTTLTSDARIQFSPERPNESPLDEKKLKIHTSETPVRPFLPTVPPMSRLFVLFLSLKPYTTSNFYLFIFLYFLSAAMFCLYFAMLQSDICCKRLRFMAPCVVYELILAPLLG